MSAKADGGLIVFRKAQLARIVFCFFLLFKAPEN